MVKRRRWASWGAIAAGGIAFGGAPSSEAQAVSAVKPPISATNAPSTATPALLSTSLGAVSTRGRWLIDGEGRTLLLHGLNLVAKRPPYTPESVGFGADDARFLAANGFSAVRLGVVYAAVEPRPGVYSESYLNSLARTVAVLDSFGIYTLLDFHQDQFNERFQGQGFPNWAVQDGGLPNPKLGFPTNYLANPALMHAFAAFFADAQGPGGIGLEDRYAAAWRHVAKRFAHTPGIVGYDLINEPAPGEQDPSCLSVAGCPGFERGRLADFYRRVATAIRRADKLTPIFYEPETFAGSGFPTALPRLNDAHAVYDWHLYVATDKQSALFTRADAHTGAEEPQFLSEFGSTIDTSTIDHAEDLADRHLVGWTEWTYFSNGVTDNAGTPSLVENPQRAPSGANVNRAQLEALVRPSAAAIAGVPTSIAYDPSSRRFTLRYTPRRGVNAATIVVVPALVYAHGHRTMVHGGAVLRDRGGVIAVRASGMSSVTVIVER